MPLPQQLVALVTGASRGVGRGVATGLANAGARVYATGRTIAEAQLDPRIVAIPCDHTDDGAVAAVFDRIDGEAGRLDVLVNSVWGGTSGWSKTAASRGRRRSGSSHAGGGTR